MALGNLDTWNLSMDMKRVVDAYGGYDMTRWPGYPILADIQGLRWVGFALGRSDT